MSTRRKPEPDGVITFYNSSALSFLQFESPEERVTGLKVGLLSHATMKRLQAQFEAEHQEARAIIQPILDGEKGLIKELEVFLGRRDWMELRRRELLHKRWTERVWLPTQRRVEGHASGRCYDPADRLRCLYADYLRHCNAKGFVSLDYYDPQEYNPFLLNITKPHYYQIQTPDLKDQLSRYSHERAREKRGVLSPCETGHKHTRGEVEEFLSPLSPAGLAPRQTDLPQTSLREVFYYERIIG